MKVITENENVMNNQLECRSFGLSFKLLLQKYIQKYHNKNMMTSEI